MQLDVSRSAPRPAVRPVRTAGVLAAAVAIAAIGWLVGPQGATPSPRVAVVAAPPIPGGTPQSATGSADGRLDTAERIAFWTTRIREQPSDFLSWIQLATAHAEQARRAADIDAYARALAAVDEALEIVPAYPPAFAVRAALRYATHDFAGAVDDARIATERMPRDTAAVATLGDALLELGRTDEALAVFDDLAALSDGPGVDIRLARTAYVTGDAAAAIIHARAAFDASVRAGDPDAPFYAYALGEYARLTGDAVVARGGFEAALAARPDDLGALLGLARIDAFDGRYDAAIAGLQRAAAIAPQPETLALLGDLLVARGDEAAARLQHDTVRLTGRLSALAGSVYDRQLSLFELDHGVATEALLRAARTALEARADAGGHDLVAWAAYRLGHLDEALRASDPARATGARDARILFHAGAIALASGDSEGGQRLLGESLALGPALDPNERSEAERLLAGPAG
jgi:tetratricopeptide (TPR) repeat protein